MNWLAFFTTKIHKEESPMNLEIQSSPATLGTPASGQPDPLLGTVDASYGAALGGSASPIQTATVQQVVAQLQTTVDTSKLKALLITLGHDIEAEWDHLIALAKKAL